jgi:hypothetical protein
LKLLYVKLAKSDVRFFHIVYFKIEVSVIVHTKHKFFATTLWQPKLFIDWVICLLFSYFSTSLYYVVCTPAKIFSQIAKIENESINGPMERGEEKINNENLYIKIEEKKLYANWYHHQLVYLFDD